MHRNLVALAATAALCVGAVTVVASRPAAASPGRQALRLHEHATSQAQIDIGAPGPSLGDQLVGAADLTDSAGRPAGRDTFVCVAVSADDTRFQCSVTYELPSGRITAQGNATVSGQRPLFEELFAITGGTRAYSSARGQVKLLQLTFDEAELSLDIEH